VAAGRDPGRGRGREPGQGRRAAGEGLPGHRRSAAPRRTVRRWPGGVRLFAAVVPPPRVAEHLAAALDRYRSGDTSLRWTRVESWHLTLAFYGSCTEAQAEERGAWLRERLRGHGPVRLRLA